MTGEAYIPVLTRARAAATSLMFDHCVVERETGRGEINPATAAKEPVYAPVFETQFKFARGGYADSEVQIGDQRIAIGTVPVHMPWDVPAFRHNDRIRVISTGPATAPRHAGAVFYINTDHVQSGQTATRLLVKEDPWPVSTEPSTEGGP